MTPFRAWTRPFTLSPPPSTLARVMAFLACTISRPRERNRVSRWGKTETSRTGSRDFLSVNTFSSESFVSSWVISISRLPAPPKSLSRNDCTSPSERPWASRRSFNAGCALGDNERSFRGIPANNNWFRNFSSQSPSVLALWVILSSPEKSVSLTDFIPWFTSRENTFSDAVRLPALRPRPCCGESLRSWRIEARFMVCGFMTELCDSSGIHGSCHCWMSNEHARRKPHKLFQ